MKQTIVLILDGQEFQTAELDYALQLNGWLPKWINAADGLAMHEDGLEPAVLVINSGRGDSSIRSIHAFKGSNPCLPLILVGENAMGFPMGIDASIPHGAPPDIWLATLKQFLSSAESQGIPKSDLQEQEWEGETFGKYKLVRKIASGGMADIFQATQMEPPGFNRVLVIKRILSDHLQNPHVIKMFLDEANLGVRLSHQNIARILDLGTVSGNYYIAMEYVDGCNLHVLIDNAKSLDITFPEPVAAFLMLQVASALDYAHTKRDSDGQSLNIVHADISPQNILVNSEGVAKLIDFGIARAANSSEQNGTALRGKPLYMSPEQALGASIDHRSDIFSLGLVLFELLSGKHGFEADDEFGLLDSVRRGEVQDIKKIKPKTSKPMTKILTKALQKSFSDRYISVHKMALDLKAYLDHLPASSGAASSMDIEPLEGKVSAFIKMLQYSQPQAIAFATSHFLPVTGFFTLPSEKTETHTKERPTGKRTEVRPVWIMPLICALFALLAWMLWISVNA